MGNVQHKGKEDGLSRFQRRKLKYDFYTFFGNYKSNEIEAKTKKK